MSNDGPQGPNPEAAQASSPADGRKTSSNRASSTRRAETRRDPAAKARAKRRRAIRTWIPQYHGGWAMVIVPPVLGMLGGGFRPAHVPLFALWFVGYFFFYCATVWLRSHCKPRYAAPVKAYGVAVLALGALVLACAPYLWKWAFAFAPLVALAGWAAWNREDRSLASGLDTVIAACLMVPVMWDVSADGATGLRATTQSWVLAAMLFGYFAGTVFYVKTNIRERGSNAYLWASIGWHVAWAAAAGALAACARVGWWHAAVWVLLVARAVAVPLLGRAGRPASVAALGAGEIVASLAVALSLL